MSVVHGPDGRIWRIRRRPDKPSLSGYLAPGAWRVEATTDDERRRWIAAGWIASSRLRDDVALALRTGSEGPAGEVAVTDADASAEASKEGGDDGSELS